jgi:von Willebrand factor type A domain
MSKQLILRPGQLQATEVDYFLVDGSGSMMDKWWETLALLDGFLDVAKTKNIHSHGIVQVFDDNDNLASIQRNGLLRDWEKFSVDPLGATWGGTALYDAINHMVRFLADEDPERCSIVIGSDGDTYDDKFTSAVEARALLDWCRAKGWQVTFIGFDFNNAKLARILGANDENTIGVQKKLLGEAGKLFGDKRANYGRTGDDINFTKDEQSNFGGYLTGPSAK